MQDRAAQEDGRETSKHCGVSTPGEVEGKSGGLEPMTGGEGKIRHGRGTRGRGGAGGTGNVPKNTEDLWPYTESLSSRSWTSQPIFASLSLLSPPKEAG